ncbi:MAG: type I-E CRISPR-associated protein Cas7/Cse4/CasC [Anaerolineae bacterium]|nr:type I-E CRISPR-associated protein Cas7/Cse4/CasC [Anaerolineae bacterium]
MFVELHMIQSFSPANLNRDDTNNPKDCEFGGVRRARISSQCIKRAIRTSPVFAETTGVDVGKRTKWLVDLLRKRLVAAGKENEEATAVLTDFVPKFASKLEKDGEKTAVLLYLSQSEVDSIVQTLLDNWESLPQDADKVAKMLVKEHKGQTSAPDIALFGRMLAEKPELGLDAACQVAHAISTHRVTMEMDFYTAVDDLNPEDTAGAGMMGFTGFDSACFYRYARIDWGQLIQNLNGDADLARRSVEGFLRAAVAAVPSGKQTSFAANNPPSLLLAVVRQDGMGWSLANAFERPVRPRGDDGLVAPSVQALDAYWGRLCQVYGTDTLVRTAALALDTDLPVESLKDAQVENLAAWVKAVTEALPA